MDALFEEKSWVEKLRIVFWVLIIVGVGLVLVIVFKGQDLVIRNPGAYQAVFLDNGQVYFGKLKGASRDFFSLTDVYYLRTGTVQQAVSSAGGQPGSAQAVNSVDLIKLGAELHAPRDEMLVSKSHVLFYEDLNEGGEIMKLIRKHQAGK